MVGGGPHREVVTWGQSTTGFGPYNGIISSNTTSNWPTTHRSHHRTKSRCKRWVGLDLWIVGCLLPRRWWVGRFWGKLDYIHHMLATAWERRIILSVSKGEMEEPRTKTPRVKLGTQGLEVMTLVFSFSHTQMWSYPQSPHCVYSLKKYVFLIQFLIYLSFSFSFSNLISL